MPPEAPEKEVAFQQDLLVVLRNLLSHHHEFGKLRLDTAEMEYDVPGGRADIAVLKPGRKPFLIIETKRKNGRVRGDIDPWNPKVLRQAIGYAALAGAKYFATANRGYFVAFRTPHDEEFSIPRHRVFATDIDRLTEEFGTEVLSHLAEYDSAETDEDRARLQTGLDWTFILRLRSFVDWLTRRVRPVVRKMFQGNPEFIEKVRTFERTRGTRLKPDHVARQMVYVLVNKILFYRALERKYPNLEPLTLAGATDVPTILARFRKAWATATEVTDDFQAIFSTDLFDDLALDDRDFDLLDLCEGIQGFIDDMGTYRLEDIEADVIGHVYERLIPDEERHDLGQFYTPPSVAELITKWAIRTPTDRVFDPAAGSGTFVVKAYQRLRQLKEEEKRRLAGSELHRELLGQLFTNDIDSFATHLTAMNLAIRDVKNPVSEVNIFEGDFFHMIPGVETRSRVDGQKVRVPPLEVVVGNPPYTRWLETPTATQKVINEERVLGKTLKSYGLVARIRGGVETALYQHFVMFAARFLKEGGRLGMIISNSWLQTDVGVQFGKFLLDTFKIKAVLDWAPRLFDLPLVATNVILLEKCSDVTGRSENNSVFAYIDRRTTVDELTAIIEHPGDFAGRTRVQVVKQSDLPRDQKWISVFFGFSRLDTKLRARTVPVGEIFEVTKGTIQYCAEEKRGLGANAFFYMTREGKKQRGLNGATFRCVPSARSLSYYSFNEQDWRTLEKAGKDVWFFHCRTSKEELVEQLAEVTRKKEDSSGLKGIIDYIAWGESDCRTRDGVVCANAQACAERVKKGGYAGWYDVGEILPADIVSSYYGQYRRRFVYTKVKLALDHDFIVLRPARRLTEQQKKAVLAMLNSTLGQLYVEVQGRTTGGGMVSMEAKHAENLRIVSPHSLDDATVEALADAFDQLDKMARAAGGVNDRNAEDKLRTAYDELDKAMAKALDLPARDLSEMRELWKAMKERRTSRAASPVPEAVLGEDRERGGLSPPMKPKRPKHDLSRVRKLDEFR